MSNERDELLHNAVLFLLDPKVKESSLTSRITFLEGKGLTESEIQEALRRASSGTGPTAGSSPVQAPVGVGRRDAAWDGPAQGYGPSGGYGYSTRMQQPPAPAIPRRDWRDVFVSVAPLYTAHSGRADRGCADGRSWLLSRAEWSTA
jgi:peroxin-14